MHQCRDVLLWCIITVLHYRYNASTLWCIKNIVCKCDWLYIMFYWYDVLRCSVMNGWCIVWCSVWWMGDAWVMHEWCDVNEWINEWTNEWMVHKWECGQCRMTVCILLYFIYICNMSLYLFMAFYWRINPIYTPGQVLVILHTNPTCHM